MTKRGQRRYIRHRRSNPAPRIPVVHIFDTFTLKDLRRKPRLKDEVLRYYWDHYSALQHQRSIVAEEIAGALVQAASRPFPFARWMRVVDYQFTNHPLSAVGSVKSMTGGRFNIGDLDPTKFAPFPALYLASDQETALVEKFGQPNETDGQTRNEMALRSERSYTCVVANGALESVIDLSKMERLRALVDVIGQFKLPPAVRDMERRLGIRNRIVSSLADLKEALLAIHWRAAPTQADVPSSSQIFGQLVARAGIEGIVFPSVRSDSGGTSLAVFPQNLQGDSFVELADTPPSATTHVRLDAKTWRTFVC
ncbi:MAG TPA: RES family NAD+ phosphorylase [Polyangia bacterium]|nr:RES family NAD+ phosphorylase [Polyangia bacterium]